MLIYTIFLTLVTISGIGSLILLGTLITDKINKAADKKDLDTSFKRSYFPETIVEFDAKETK